MNAADRVMQSYGCCCASTGLLDDFCRHFLVSSPQIRAKLATTDITVQRHLLRTGIMSPVMYTRGMSDSRLRAFGASHLRAALNTRPELYDLWLDALLMAVVEHDRDCDVGTRDAWRDVMGRGITVIKPYY